MNFKEKYELWLFSNIINEQTKAELLAVKENCGDIEDRFYKDLEFGTGGLRGLIGAGTNRINIYTVRKATQGLADYLLSTSDDASVAIAYDSRHFSPEFAKEAALVLAANGIKTYLFDSLRPTPELSFAVRELACDAGIVITASHNPKEYNGYKVYGSDGGQITLDIANQIISRASYVDIFSDIKTISEEEAVEKKLLLYIGKHIDEKYLERLLELSINKDVAKRSKDFSIVYTPLHGTGLMPVTKILELLGYKDVYVVKEQESPNGDFPTVKVPNPEDRSAMNMAIDLAMKKDANIVLATDPDADRVSVAVKDANGVYTLLTGNQIGALLMDYIVNNKNAGDRPAVVKTIVTSELGANIAKKHGVRVFDTLTGFKFIGEKIKEFEESGDYEFLFGYEESFGYLAADFVRDKDAVMSIALIVEMAAFYELSSTTLLEKIEEIYKDYGYYLDALESHTFKGISGKEKIKQAVNNFRNQEKIKALIEDVSLIEDYESGEAYDFLNDEVSKLDLPKSNVVKIFMTDDSWFAIRPSGTEPKLKVYYSALGSSRELAVIRLEEIKNIVSKIMM